jgi:hypothetical protein
MPGFETPHQEQPPIPGGTGPFIWTHSEPEPAVTGTAALQTAKLGAWDALDATTRARHLRMLAVMSLQAATLRTEPQKLGALSAATFADEEHNAAGAAVARTLMLIAPRGPAVVAQHITTKGGEPPVMLGPGETGAPWVAIAVIAAVAVVGAAAYLIGRQTAETADRSDFRDAKTRQLLSTQATAIEVLAKHAEREKLAGKVLPFTEEEKALLRSLEDTQRVIVQERREPLPSPFEGAKTLADLGQATTGFLEALLPLALVGGALYLLTRFGGDAEQRGPPALPARASPSSGHPETITLTRNKDGVYEHQEGHG